MIFRLYFRGCMQILTDSEVTSDISELKTHSGKTGGGAPANEDKTSHDGWYLCQSVPGCADALQDQFHFPGQGLLGTQQHAGLHPKSCLGETEG